MPPPTEDFKVVEICSHTGQRRTGSARRYLGRLIPSPVPLETALKDLRKEGHLDAAKDGVVHYWFRLPHGGEQDWADVDQAEDGVNA